MLSLRLDDATAMGGNGGDTAFPAALACRQRTSPHIPALQQSEHLCEMHLSVAAG
jgi:hypothetical protein